MRTREGKKGGNAGTRIRPEDVSNRRQAQQMLGKLAPTPIDLQNTRVAVDGYTDNVPVGAKMARTGNLHPTCSCRRCAPTR